MKNLTQTKLAIYTILFITLFNNYSFFKNTLEVYPIEIDNIGFLLSLPIVIIALTLLIFMFVQSKYTTKPLLIFILITSSLTGYFMNSYHVIIDDDMIRNMMQTNLKESMDLLSLKQILYLLFLGVIPSYFIYKAEINYRNFKLELYSRLKTIVGSIVVMGLFIFIFSQHYTSFAREHKPLRFTINPTYWIYSIGKYVGTTFGNDALEFQKIGEDATLEKEKDALPKLIIMVVGEAVRADHFSLNGYKRETNPLIKKENIINFPNISSCGTSTAVSVPCMFSVYNRSDYSYKKGISTENVLDVLNHTNKIDILWRDNNSDSKGVATRLEHEDYKSSQKNSICIEGECRDEGMLVGLNTYIKRHADRDVIIVLHQMGNHGPAYYKRYPKAYEKFKPVCKTNQLEECTAQEITNGYDNALLYSDYFLAKTINFLKNFDKTHQTAMIYMADHGESLGESGLYLHGLPYFIAPKAQTNVATFVWFGEKIKANFDLKKIQKNREKEYSQDNLFHTLLGIFNVKTEVYKKEMDILSKKVQK